MIGRIGSLFAKIMSHIVPATDVSAKEFGSNVRVRRRVEVTVERESVSVLFQGHSVKGAPGMDCAETGAEARWESPSLAHLNASRPPRSGDEKISARRPQHIARGAASGVGGQIDRNSKP